MDDEKTDKLMTAVMKQLQSDEDNLNAAVDIAIDFSKQNSIAPKILLDHSSTFVSKDIHAAAYVFAKAAANLSEGKIKVGAYFIAGFASYHMGRNKEAEEQYKIALSIDPNNTDIHSNYGLLLYETERNDEAEEQYKMALSIDPNHVNAHYNYGNLLYETERNDEAEEQYKIALGIDPDNVNAHYNYGLLLHETKRNDEAEEQYKIALILDPNNADIHSNYGNLLYETKRNDEAEKHYKIALGIDLNNADIHSNYGLLLYETERNDEAEEQYKIALGIDPNSVNAHSNYGNLLYKTERNDEAEEQYKIVLGIDPNNANIHSNYGLLLYETKRNDEAEEHYKIALDIDPNNADIHSNYGLILIEKGRNEEAEKQYKKALGIDPNHANAHYNYGNLLYKTGRNEKAEKQYKMALGIDLNHANAHGAYGHLLFAMGKEKKALEETKTASSLFREKDENVMEHLVLAWLYERYAERYYERGNARKEKKKKSSGYFRKSGKYAGLAGDEYIETGKHVRDEGKGLYLSQGYTLKGRSEIRILDFSFRDKIELRMRNLRRDDYEIAKFELIMNGVQNAAGYYKEAAEHSPKRNAQCDACSNCMSALGSMLDYMLSVIHQRAAPELSDKIKEWDGKLSYAEMVQQKSEKGEKFVEALHKFIPCIINLEKYKNKTRHEHKKALKDCMIELEEVASNIEGPLQEIIENSAYQMKKCMLKHKLYTSGAETETIKDGAISKIGNKVWDKILDNIATIVLIFITSLSIHLFRLFF